MYLEINIPRVFALWGCSWFCILVVLVTHRFVCTDSCTCSHHYTVSIVHMNTIGHIILLMGLHTAHIPLTDHFTQSCSKTLQSIVASCWIFSLEDPADMKSMEVRFIVSIKHWVVFFPKAGTGGPSARHNHRSKAWRLCKAPQSHSGFIAVKTIFCETSNNSFL